jgi:hypothetical protein
VALKLKRKPPPKPQAKPAAKKRKPAEPISIEHRVAVTGVALSVSYGRDRSERMELRGTATVNANAPSGSVRTTGFVALALKRGAKIANRVSYAPASLNRNLVLTLYVDEADLNLFREVFVTGTGPEGSDPALFFWARTVRPIEEAGTEPVIEFGYKLDFDPAPSGPR